MTSATLPIQTNFRGSPDSAPGAVFATAFAGVLSHVPAAGGWLRHRGTAGSALLHGAALLAIWTLSAGTVPAPAMPAAVELIRLQPEPKPQLVPPKPVPEKPVPLALSKPVAQSLPVPKTVAGSAAAAETTPPPAAPVQAAPIGPLTPSAPVAAAPTAPAGPKVIATEGIPTDYVNQVYSRINRNADYPREAKLRRQQGRVGYKLTLSPQGALIAFDLQSSGVEALDQAAQQAIERAAPFPKLPDLGGSTYLLAGNIVFKIN